MIAAPLLDRGLLPDWLVRKGIRRLLRRRLRETDRGAPDANQAAIHDWVEDYKRKQEEG